VAVEWFKSPETEDKIVERAAKMILPAETATL
jgi:hypothetical protein